MQASTASSPAGASSSIHRGSCMVPAIQSGTYALRWQPLPVRVKKPSILLAAVAMLLLTVTCTAAMWYSSFDPRLVLFCAYLWLFYGALYLWRRLRARHHCQHAVLRRGLGYAAVGLGVLLSAIFLYSFARVIPLLQAVGVWLFALLVAYCLYRVIVLHIEEEEEESVQVQAPVNCDVRPPV